MPEQGINPQSRERGFMAPVYGIDELMWDLTLLGDQVATMKTWESLLERLAYESAANPILGTLDMMVTWISSQFDDEKAKILGSNQLAQLEDLPQRMAAIVGIPFQPFVQTAGELSPLALKFTDMSNDPGQILTRVIGQWEGSAAGDFEEYFGSYENAQLRQAELFANLINGLTSIGESLIEFQKSAKSLVEAAYAVATKINDGYESELQRRAEAAIAVAVIVVSTVITAGAATGPAVGATLAAGGLSLAQNVISAATQEREFQATDSISFIESFTSLVGLLESSLDAIDTEVYSAIETVKSEWSISDCTIPEPPGASEVNEESFRHEST
jgi:hypothetical protein